jgi:hypothetical protein
MNESNIAVVESDHTLKRNESHIVEETNIDIFSLCTHGINELAQVLQVLVLISRVQDYVGVVVINLADNAVVNNATAIVGDDRK